MELTQEEQAILDGAQGETMAKALRTIVRYGELFEAERLLPLDAPIHVVTSMGMAGLDAAFDMMDELIAAGLKAKRPFTADPRPFDFDAPECGCAPCSPHPRWSSRSSKKIP